MLSQVTTIDSTRSANGWTAIADESGGAAVPRARKPVVEVQVGEGSRSPKEDPLVLDERDHVPKDAVRHGSAIWRGDVEEFLEALPADPLFDLVVTSPPYNLGKEYESKSSLADYLAWQTRIIDQIVPRLKDSGSICWQIGNYVDNGEITPLDMEFGPIFRRHGLKLRNRIVWHFGHGLHTRRRFSGRYEVVLWYTKTDDYVFDLDAVRIPSKYPGKKHFKGPKKGEYSGNPLGKNPSDVWNIPNVKSNHVEKTNHPCQFPVGLVERLILALTKPGDLVFDPFAGVASSGVAAQIHGRRFVGCELEASYAKTGLTRLTAAFGGRARYRPHDRPVFDHTKSKLSMGPNHDEEGDL